LKVSTKKPDESKHGPSLILALGQNMDPIKDDKLNARFGSINMTNSNRNILPGSPNSALELNEFSQFPKSSVCMQNQKMIIESLEDCDTEKAASERHQHLSNFKKSMSYLQLNE